MAFPHRHWHTHTHTVNRVMTPLQSKKTRLNRATSQQSEPSEAGCAIESTHSSSSSKCVTEKSYQFISKVSQKLDSCLSTQTLTHTHTHTMNSLEIVTWKRTKLNCSTSQQSEPFPSWAKNSALLHRKSQWVHITKGKKEILTSSQPCPKDWIGWHHKSITKVRRLPRHGMGNSSACWDEARISFVFFDVTTPSSLFRWETVQSAAMWNGSVLFLSR